MSSCLKQFKDFCEGGKWESFVTDAALQNLLINILTILVLVIVIAVVYNYMVVRNPKDRISLWQAGGVFLVSRILLSC